MAATFTDGVTKICSDWLNAVSETVFDALGAASTPGEALENIGGATEAYVDDADAALQAQIDVLQEGSGLLYREGLTLYLDPAGDAEPVNPLAGNPFDKLSSVFSWLRDRYIVRSLEIDIAAGTYSETTIVTAPETIRELILTGADEATTTIEFGNAPFTVLSGELVIPGSSGVRLDFNGGTEVLNISGDLTVRAGGTLGVVAAAASSGEAIVLLEGRSVIEAGGELTVTGDDAGAYLLRTNGEYFINLGTVTAADATKNVIVGSPAGYVPYALGTWAGSAAVIYDNASPRATAGYFSDPRTGVITQWGFVSSGAGTSGSVTFPKEFVSNCRAVLTTSTEASTPVGAFSYSTTGFNWEKGPVSANFSWVAFGT